MRAYLSLMVGMALSGCAATSKTPQDQFEEITVKQSYLEADAQSTEQQPQLVVGGAEQVDAAKYKSLSPFSQGYTLPTKEQLQSKFSNADAVSAAVDKMPITEFLHYSLGEQLSLNYVLAGDLPTNTPPVTLKIRDDMSSRAFFSLIQDVLQQRGMVITENDNVFYVVKADTTAKGNVSIGVGSLTSDVPNTATQVLQIIPTRFGISTTLERTVTSMVDASVTADLQQDVLFVQGRRAEVIRAIELVQLLDKPFNRGKHVGIMELTYVNSQDFIAQAEQLLINEGVTVGTGVGKGQNVVFVPLTQIGSVAVFASDEQLIDRVKYWGRQLDKPATNSESQYFMYSPKFARATDLGESLAPLLGQMAQRSAATQATAPAQTQTGQNNSASRPARAVGGASLVDNLSMVIDERSNSLIFYGAGSEYQALLPLINKLDVLPRQVLLEVTVVEVRLTGQFEKGVEWALRDFNPAGDLVENITTGLGGISGNGLRYAYNAFDFDVVANLFRNNSLANIVSNPTLVVRDGVTATMSVGSDIPIQTAITGGGLQDARNTQQFAYRKAGLQLNVKPTVNAQNIVLMEIDQFLSNTAPGISPENPAFFERTLATEVVAKSGQTILLGGIISEDNSSGDQSVPGLADIPLLGNLFSGENQSSDKTELVVLVTARVLDNTEEWEQIMRQFEGGLQSIKLNN